MRKDTAFNQRIQEIFDEVNELSIVDVISSRIEVVNPSSTNADALCPFHDDHNLGSFKISKSKNLYKCFSCDATGNGIRFIAEYDHISYYQAAMKIAFEFGIITDIEYKKLSSKHLIDFSELINIGTQVIHKLCANSEPDKYNKSYLSTAIKWAIRNEIRRRYKWYVLKNQQENSVVDEENQCSIREAVYKTILSVDEMAEGDNPTQIRDFKRNPEETIKEIRKKQYYFQN